MKFLNRFRITNKTLGAVLFGLFAFLILASFVFAQGIGEISSPFQSTAPDITTCSTSVKDCILWAFSFAFSFLIWLAGTFAVIMFVYAGILYISQPSKASEIHSRLYWGAIGLIVALSAFGIVKTIEFSITRNAGAFLMAPVYAQENPLNQFIRNQENIRPAGISGCENAKSIFSYIKGGQMGDVPSGLLGKCILGFIGTKVLPVVYTISLLWSVGVLLWLGLEYVQSGKNDSSLHQKLLWAIIGVVVTVLAFSAVKAIEIALTVPENVAPPPGSGTQLPVSKICVPSITSAEVAGRFSDMIIYRNSVAALDSDKQAYLSYFGTTEGRQTGMEELIYTKAMAEEIKCNFLNLKKSCANNLCITDQIGWANKIRTATNLDNSKYGSGVTAKDAFENYDYEFGE